MITMELVMLSFIQVVCCGTEPCLDPLVKISNQQKGRCLSDGICGSVTSLNMADGVIVKALGPRRCSGTHDYQSCHQGFKADCTTALLQTSQLPLNCIRFCWWERVQATNARVRKSARQTTLDSACFPSQSTMSSS